MITRFDHAVLAVDSLSDTVSDIADRFGFDVSAGGRHTGLGTENAIVRFGLDYIEVLGIHSREEVLAAGGKRSPLLDFITNEGGGWLSYCMATDDIDGLANRFRKIGLEATGPFTMQRVRPDGTVLTWRLLVPGTTAWRRPWPFFIQWDLPDAERLELERPGRHRMGKARVWGAKIVVRDLQAAKYLYSEQLGFQYEDGETCSASAAESAHFRLGDFRTELISPTAPGFIMDELERRGEGLSELVLEVDHGSSARNTLGEYAISGASTDSELAVDLMQAQGGASCARLAVRSGTRGFHPDFRESR
jgi:hypothetical protein